MTHRFFVLAEQLSGEQVSFSPAQAHQIRNVLRLGRGDRVRAFDGTVARDWVVELIEPSHGRVVGTCAHASEPRTRLDVYPALLQRDKFEPVLQKLTELGARSITPVIAARGLVRQAPDERRYARWVSIVREAAEQCGRGRAPCLQPVQPLVSALTSAPGTRVIAYEGERRRGLGDALGDRPEHVALFVGPEGGFSPEEIDCARRTDARVVSLGPRVLRSETASPVLAALVLYELGDLSWPEDDCA
jgi:16S rRNA (uracil1498-N3)-methyltransferase